jgi:hypothetical protein
MAEQTAILAEKHLAVFMSPDQCFSDLITPEKDPGITGASSPFFDYLLAEGNEVLQSLVASEITSCSSFHKVMNLVNGHYIACTDV